ncbi:Lrp/AsnC family transcriptional regulator [Candidatus Woesearchaeota archaeon]|nr:Lrp/AsnC family transcriptional regulator [Candidatus Woesearchaeota archaeon]
MEEKFNKISAVKIDNTDEKIINELIENAKTPLRTLAKKLNISFVTVMNRIKRLEALGVIENYTAKINYDKLGYGVSVVIDVRISKGKLFELENKIAKSNNVYIVYDTTGDFDAVIIGKFKSTASMDHFLKSIQKYPFVERTHTKLVLNTIKESPIKLQ